MSVNDDSAGTVGTDNAAMEFFRHFQLAVGNLQDEISQLQSLATIEDEEPDKIDSCLVGIARLSKEVQDASSYVPAYDQRSYANTVKLLSERLQNARIALNPARRFTFKSDLRSSQESERARAEQSTDSGAQRRAVSGEGTVVQDSHRDDIPFEGNAIAPTDRLTLRRPSFSTSRTVDIRNHQSVHILLPYSASRATSLGSISNISSCVVDCFVPTIRARPFSSTALRQIHDSLIVLGHVQGATHVTDMRNSTLVVATRQLRLHGCIDCIIYLFCASRPIVEDCQGLRFAPLPDMLLPSSSEPPKNQWDQVDDFNWLKPEQSPNWSVLPMSVRLDGIVWMHEVIDQTFEDCQEALAKAGVNSATIA